ncbi:hypothetical protein ONA92_01975 [Mycobacteroides salmoniphilum]|uniref:hypothetical protein n=1 Tax=Mycobacteroides salmoniphilum TaxID=404941 RepID=UPI003569A0E0
MTTPGGPGSLNPNARFGITGDSAHGETAADLSQRLQGEMEDRLKADIKGSSGWKGASDAAFGGLMLRGTPGQPVSIPLAIVASLAARLLGVDPQSWVISTDPHENLERILAELKKVPIFDDLIELITGVEDGDESDLGTWALGIRNALQGIDLSDPGSILTAIGKAAGQFFKGVIPVSWLADVIHDLINGAGEFLNPSSVTANPYWSWDSVMPGWHGGGSVRATANGTQQVLRVEDPTDVVTGQILKIQSGVRWTGLTATAGSNPIKVGWTPYDANGNPMADVIVSQLQPSTTDGAWQWVPAISGLDKWTVPAGVSKVTPLLILDSGATAGNVWFSNVLPWLSNLAGQELIHNLPDDLGDLADGIAANVVALAGKLAQGDFDGFLAAIFGIVNPSHSAIAAKFQALGADGKIDTANIIGLAAQLAAYALQSAVQTFMDTVGGTVGASMTDIFNRLSKLSSTGTIAGAAITGTISSVVSGVGAVLDAIGQGAGLIGSGFTNLQVQNQTTLNTQIAAQAAAATSALQAQFLRNQVTVPAGLMTYITTFGGSDGSPLPAEFTGSDLKIRTANGYCGIEASKGDGTYYVTCNKATTTDDVQATVVIGDAGGLNSIATYTLFSSDSTDSTGAYLAVNGNSVQVGKFTRSGATFTFAAPFMSWSGPLGQGIAVTTYRKTNNWVLDVGGDVKATATDSTVTTGASNRYGGGIAMIRKTASTGWFSGNYQYDSLRLASVFLGDFYAKATNYSAARLTRAVGAANTAGPTHPYSLAGNASVTVTGAWGAGAFGVIGFSSDDMVANTANGTITVNTPGLYYVEHRDPAWTWSAGTAIEPSASALDVVVNTVNHITLEGDYKLLDGTANTDTGSWAATGHTAVPIPAFLRLNAGDVIQLGYTVTLKNTGGSSRSGNAVFTLTGTVPGLLGIYKMG